MDKTKSVDSQVPLFVSQLGYAGLLPFMILAMSLWIFPDIYFERITQALLSYAAIILSFMGAVHWGLAMVMEDAHRRLQFVISVVPALVAWFASLLSPMWNYSILIIMFVSLCLFDSFMARKHKAPEWYPFLRIPLTVVVIISLIVAQLSLLSK